AADHRAAAAGLAAAFVLARGGADVPRLGRRGGPRPAVPRRGPAAGRARDGPPAAARRDRAGPGPGRALGAARRALLPRRALHRRDPRLRGGLAARAGRPPGGAAGAAPLDEPDR